MSKAIRASPYRNNKGPLSRMAKRLAGADEVLRRAQKAPKFIVHSSLFIDEL